MRAMTREELADALAAADINQELAEEAFDRADTAVRAARDAYDAAEQALNDYDEEEN